MRTYQCWKNNAPSAALVWSQLIFWLVTVAAVAAVQVISIGLPGCTTICGNVSVPYPFGIEPGCSLKGFNLTCDASYTPPQLFIHDAARVTEISLDDSSMAGRRTGALVKAVDRRRRQGGAAEHAPGQLLLRGSATVSLDAARAERNTRRERDMPQGSGHC
jgi:hypothetical protein